MIPAPTDSRNTPNDTLEQFAQMHGLDTVGGRQLCRQSGDIMNRDHIMEIVITIWRRATHHVTGVLDRRCPRPESDAITTAPSDLRQYLLGAEFTYRRSMSQRIHIAAAYMPNTAPGNA
jgi:hypothetical protein